MPLTNNVSFSSYKELVNCENETEGGGTVDALENGVGVNRISGSEETVDEY